MNEISERISKGGLLAALFSLLAGRELLFLSRLGQ